jgi:phosphoglycolate phosphatase
MPPERGEGVEAVARAAAEAETRPAAGGFARPRAILFDWDNTLVDSWPSIHAALVVTFEHFGLEPWTFEQTQARVRHSLRDSFPHLFGDRWEEAGEFYLAEFRRIHLDLLTPLAGAHALLQDLAGRGIYLGVVSNKTGLTLRREAEHLGWTPLFGRLVGAQDAARDKPAVDPVDLALSGSGIERGPSVWFVGDTDIDMLCATRSGCVPFLVRGHPPGADEFAGSAPAWHGAGCEALCNFVRTL